MYTPSELQTRIAWVHTIQEQDPLTLDPEFLAIYPKALQKAAETRTVDSIAAVQQHEDWRIGGLEDSVRYDSARSCTVGH